MRRVVMFSGGIGSWAAAKRVVASHGIDDLTLLFADTLIEDADLYRFIGQAAVNVCGNNHKELIRLAEGRTPWQVFRDERYLGNTRADPCSKILKRQMADRWLDYNCDPAETVVYVGIDWTEVNRFDRLRERKLPWIYEAPLVSAPYWSKNEMLAMARSEGLEPPRLYQLGFPHNNCGGGCIKAGQGHFAHLLKVLPDVYAEWEQEEEKMRVFLSKDVAILRDRRGGSTTPLTLAALREKIQSDRPIDHLEIGGCGCFLDD